MQKQLDLLDLPERRRNQLEARIRRYLNCGVGGRYCRQRAICDGCRRAKLRQVIGELGHAFDSLSTTGFVWQYVVVTFLSDPKDPWASTVRGFEDHIARANAAGGRIFARLQRPGAAMFRKTSRGTRSRGKGAVHLDLHFYGPPVDARKLRDYARTVDVTIGNIAVNLIDHPPGKRHERAKDPRGSRQGVLGVAGYVWKADTQCCVPREVPDDLVIANDRRLREDVRWAIAAQDKRLTQKYGEARGLTSGRPTGRTKQRGRDRKTKARPPPPTWTDRAIFLWQAASNWRKPLSAIPRWVPPPVGQILHTKGRTVLSGDSGAHVWQKCVARLPDGGGLSTPFKIVNLAIARARLGGGTEVPHPPHKKRRTPAPPKRLGKSWAFECLTWNGLRNIELACHVRGYRGPNAHAAALVDLVAEATGTCIATVDDEGTLSHATYGFFRAAEHLTIEEFDLPRPPPSDSNSKDIWLSFHDGRLDGRGRISMGLREENQYEAMRFATSFVAPDLIDSPEPDVVLEFVALAYLVDALTSHLDGGTNGNVPHAVWTSSTDPHAAGIWGTWTVPQQRIRELLLPALERVTRCQIIALDETRSAPVYGAHTVDLVLGDTLDHASNNAPEPFQKDEAEQQMPACDVASGGPCRPPTHTPPLARGTT